MGDLQGKVNSAYDHAHAELCPACSGISLQVSKISVIVPLSCVPSLLSGPHREPGLRSDHEIDGRGGGPCSRALDLLCHTGVPLRSLTYNLGSSGRSYISLIAHLGSLNVTNGIPKRDTHIHTYVCTYI